MKNTDTESSPIPALESFLEKASGLELARRSLVGAPVYTVISLIMLVGTPILRSFGWQWAVVEASLLIMLGGIRVWYALGFERRYEHIGEKAVLQFSILTALQSLTLGILAAIVIWYNWAAQEAVLTIVLSAGCIAAGTSALSVRWSAHLIFLFCVLAPFGIAVYLVGGLAKAMLIVGFLVLMAFLVQDGGQARQTYFQQLKNRYAEEIGQRRLAIESQARKDFLADIGHEIRTPVSAIIGMTNLMQGEDLGKKSREFMEIIRKSSDVLLDLIDNIPDAIKSRPDILQSTQATISLRESINGVIELFRPEVAVKGLELISMLDKLPENLIFTDRNHLEQVLVNLLGNAVKFTDQGTVTLSAERRKPEGSDQFIEFSVSDTGVGMPAELQESVFEFSNPKDAKSSRPGLGLPMCKGLVDLMGGEIRIESEEGQGTTVRFTIHTELDQADIAIATPPAKHVIKKTSAIFNSELSASHPHQILVVEDHEFIRRAMRLHLEKMGYQADEAVDGQQAVTAVMEANYDLIFMDLRMPNMNGVEATRWIREHFTGGRGISIIALTGDATPETRERCMEAGMDDFVAKPVMVKELERVLRKY
ncbi:MAG: signal transduction histidine kinase [Lysobacterales bacterium]|jgi:signal transduction histidine kinase